MLAGFRWTDGAGFFHSREGAVRRRSRWSGRVTQIRNQLVHPKAEQERVYRRDGLVAEVWLLTRHYLVLLILHSLGYQGSYRDLRKLRGFAGDVDKVPVGVAEQGHRSFVVSTRRHCQ